MLLNLRKNKIKISCSIFVKAREYSRAGNTVSEENNEGERKEVSWKGVSWIRTEYQPGWGNLLRYICFSFTFIVSEFDREAVGRIPLELVVGTYVPVPVHLETFFYS